MRVAAETERRAAGGFEQRKPLECDLAPTTHLDRDPLGSDCAPHLLECFAHRLGRGRIVVSHVRRPADHRDAVCSHFPGHLDGGWDIDRTIVEAGQNVTVEIDHRPDSTVAEDGRRWSLPAVVPIDGAAAATFALVFAAIVSLGASEGGYFPSSWGWSAFVFAVVGLLALLTRDRIELSRLELSYLGAFTALLTWTALSLLWTDTVTQTMFEVERTLSYVMFAVALALVARRTSAHLVVAATLAGITVISAYALATRLLPDTLTVYDPIGRNRLADPLGYWNALGAFAAVGCVLALGFAARADRTWLRGLSASALVVLVPTMFFTFSRGGWVALFIGVAVLIALDPRRLQTVTVLFVVLPWPALTVLIASRSSALTTVGSPLADATDEGRRLLAVILLLGVVTFLSVVGLVALERRFDPAPWVRRAYGASLVGIALVVVAVGVVALGGPTAIKHRATTSIHRVSPDESGDQTQRLFSLSAHGRLELWATAIDEAQARPVLGGGAGSFEQWWYAHRRVEATVRDAHNLYLETAAELGLVGVALLVALLALPFIAALRARRQPVVPFACAAWATYLAHAAVDWDWEMPALTVCALACAGSVFVAARETSAVELGRFRWLGVAALVATGLLAFVSMNGNRGLTQATEALESTDLAATIHHARDAARWAPWSSEPLRLQADAALQQGRRSAAQTLYARAIAKDRSNWELWFGLALASDGSLRQFALTQAAKLNPLSRDLRRLREAS